jgi:molecular chaperone GrpE
MPDTNEQQEPQSFAQESEHSSAPQPEAASTTRTEAETLPNLADMIKTAELKAAEHHDAWLRAKAEGENIRRRAQDDIAKAGKFATEKFAGELLAVKDSLEAALTNEHQDASTLHSGVELTLKQLTAAFEKSGLVEINPLDEKFDPHRHQAISQLEADGEPNRVVSVLQKGYSLYERVIRPALVVVSKARPAA